MIHQKLNPAPDLNKLGKLARKEYRDSYLRSQVHSWIAYQFQSLRKKKRLTQNQMANLTGKPQSVISRLESEEYRGVSVQTLLDFACAMDVALVVQFVSYPAFLERMRDKSETAMQPDTISESIAQQERVTFMADTYRSIEGYQTPRISGNYSAFAANEHNVLQTSQPMYSSRDMAGSLTGMRS